MGSVMKSRHWLVEDGPMAARRRDALARRRRALGLSQQDLAEKVRVDARTVGRWERGESDPQPWQLPSLARALVLTLDELDWHFVSRDQYPAIASLPADSHHLTDAPQLGSVRAAGNVALRISADGDVVAQIDRRTVLVATASALAFLADFPVDGTLVPALPVFARTSDAFGAMVSERWPGAAAVGAAPQPGGAEWQLLLPSGRSMSGTAAAVRLVSAVPREERAALELADPRETEGFARRAGRGFIVAALEDEARYFLLDARTARSRVQGGHETVSIPYGFELDDLTFGIVWAVANLDDALLSDDRALDDARHDLKAYERLTASSVGRESAPDLNPIAHMYLGSDFCARFILRGLPALGAPSVAWTKEQHGEEASTWLLFDHKYRYLRETVSMVGGSMDRGFCIPTSAVATSPRYERVLLFLAIALMESLGIRVYLTTDANYASVEGFVIAPEHHNAIIADWVGGEGMWHVDLIGKSSSVGPFEQVAGDVTAQSIIAAAAPARRLSALADYLELDRAWLSRRCAEIGTQGTSSLVQSRSRLISPAGLDTACRYVGSLRL
jgi:transcriptional regulator with XRE-family HTH domain